jgi:hypothetical protein
MPVAELYVIGDSFAVMKQENINPNVWPILLAQRLGYNLSNTSCSGAGQDWLLAQLHQIKKQITPDDQLIITLSDCNRFWFFEDFPDVAEPRATELGEIIGKERAKAAEYYFRYIQRDSLSINQQISRLGLIAHLTTIYNWRPPIILLSFQDYVPEQELFPNLIFSKGALIYDVSNLELESGSNDRVFFKGIDVRHNHMCLSNHKILADKLYNQIINNQHLDLTSGFLTRLLKKNYDADQEFCNRELDLSALEHKKKMLTSNSNFSDNWLRRIAM